MSKTKQAFFDAKQQIKDAIDTRIKDLEEFVGHCEKATEGKRISRLAHYELQSARAQIMALNDIHDFVRNAVLYEKEKYE